MFNKIIFFIPSLSFFYKMSDYYSFFPEINFFINSQKRFVDFLRKKKFFDFRHDFVMAGKG